MPLGWRACRGLNSSEITPRKKDESSLHLCWQKAAALQSPDKLCLCSKEISAVVAGHWD